MPQCYSFEIPTEGASKEVLETDLRYYLGHDAKIVDSRHSDRYIIQTLQRPQRGMITSLKDDTSRWRRSDDYHKHRPYSGSRIHQDRKRACRGDDDTHRKPGVAPITVPSRPPLVQQYSSSSGYTFGSLSSTYDSISRIQSRRPSDAMSPIDGGSISRTTSVSSDYGTGGSIGWNQDPSYGTTGGYGWASSQRRPSAYGPP